MKPLALAVNEPDYSRRRHTHSDDVPCIVAGPEGHPPVPTEPEAER